MRERPFQPCADGLLLFVRATPKASRDEIIGLSERPDGVRLAVKVRVAPEDGKANAAILQLIAGALDLKPSSLSVSAGQQNRDKTILIQGDPNTLQARAETWLEELTS